MMERADSFMRTSPGRSHRSQDSFPPLRIAAFPAQRRTAVSASSPLSVAGADPARGGRTGLDRERGDGHDNLGVGARLEDDEEHADLARDAVQLEAVVEPRGVRQDPRWVWQCCGIRIASRLSPRPRSRNLSRVERSPGGDFDLSCLLRRDDWDIWAG